MRWQYPLVRYFIIQWTTSSRNKYHPSTSSSHFRICQDQELERGTYSWGASTNEKEMTKGESAKWGHILSIDELSGWMTLSASAFVQTGCLVTLKLELNYIWWRAQTWTTRKDKQAFQLACTHSPSLPIRTPVATWQIRNRFLIWWYPRGCTWFIAP